MTTRFIVSALTAGALALGSISSFAYGPPPSTYQGVAPSYPQPGTASGTNPHPQYEGPTAAQQWRQEQAQARAQRQQQWQRNQQWQRGQEARRDHDRREHEWREHRDHDRRDYGYVYQQPDYAYQGPGYVYQQPGYVYEQPAYGYPQPYYDGYYDNGDAGTNLVVGTILGGIIGSAIANSR